MTQYFLDYYQLYCPDDCDKKECPKNFTDEHEEIPPKCPKQEKSLYSRGDLGIVAKDDLDYLIRENEDPDVMIFRKAEDIPLNTFNEQCEHLSLLKWFTNNPLQKYHSFYIHYQIERAKRLQFLAKERREVRAEALATVVQGKLSNCDNEDIETKDVSDGTEPQIPHQRAKKPKQLPNEERDAKLYELACDIQNYPLWNDVVAIINTEFPDYELGKDGAQAAAKSYAKRHKKDMPPKRKPGRRPEK